MEKLHGMVKQQPAQKAAAWGLGSVCLAVGCLCGQRFWRLCVLAAKKTANGKANTAQTPGIKKSKANTSQEERTVKTLPSNLLPKPKTTTLKSSDKDKIKAKGGDKGGGKDKGAGKDSGRPSAARAPGARKRNLVVFGQIVVFDLRDLRASMGWL